MNQQVETLQPLCYESETVTDLDMGTIELSCKLQFSTHSEGTEGPPLADPQLIVTNVQIKELELLM